MWRGLATISTSGTSCSTDIGKDHDPIWCPSSAFPIFNLTGVPSPFHDHLACLLRRNQGFLGIHNTVGVYRSMQQFLSALHTSLFDDIHLFAHISTSRAPLRPVASVTSLCAAYHSLPLSWRTIRNSVKRNATMMFGAQTVL